MMLQNRCCQVGEEISICSLIKIGALKRWVVGSVVLGGEEMGGGWEWQREKRDGAESAEERRVQWVAGFSCWFGRRDKRERERREAGHVQWVAGFSCRSEVRRKIKVWPLSILPHKLLPIRTATVDSASQELAGLSLLRKPRQRWRGWERGVRHEAWGCVSVYVWEENLANTVRVDNSSIKPQA